MKSQKTSFRIIPVHKAKAPLLERQGGEMVSPCYLSIDSDNKTVSLIVGESDSSRSRDGLEYTFKVPCSLSQRQCTKILKYAAKKAAFVDFEKSIEENRLGRESAISHIALMCEKLIGEIDVFPTD